MQKTASKNIIPSGSYEFLNLAHNTIITIRVQTSNRVISRKQEIKGNKKLNFHFYTLYIHNLY